MNKKLDGIFEETKEFPSPEAMRHFSQLYGIDSVKEWILKEAKILLNPQLIDDWSTKNYGSTIFLVTLFKDRSPLFIFGGDVGTGKTALAKSFGDPIAREMKIPVTLYSLSLNARGTGAVGEMTSLISAAFNQVRQVAQKSMSNQKCASSAVIFLIDEADALAQSREFSQMHHEDRAGVNALIRGIDELRIEKLPVIVVMCTNRINAIDPSIKRRAAVTFEFIRPNLEQRVMLLKNSLIDIGFSDEQLRKLAKLTGTNGDNTTYGYTYSDLTQRFLPSLILDAFPEKSIDFDRACEIAKLTTPTPPFAENSESKIE